MTKGDRSAHRRDAEGDGGRSDMDAQTMTVPAANGMDHRPSAQALASEATALNVADHRVAGREEAGVRGEAGGGQDHEVEGDRPLAQSAVSTSASVPAAAATAMGPTEDGRADAEARGGEHEKVSADDASEPPVRGTFDYSFSRRIACLSEPAGVAARGYRALQTHLLAGHVRDGRRGLAVCAPTPACGCTSVAVNLAVAFAQAGINTLLLRPPYSSEPAAMSGDVNVAAPQGVVGDANVVARVKAPPPAIRRTARPDQVRSPALAAEAPSSPHGSESLRDEIEAIERASRALSQRRCGLAREHLAAYEARFPNGRLRREADVVAIEIAGRSGQGERARTAARRFVAQFPDTPYALRLAPWLRDDATDAAGQGGVVTCTDAAE